MTVLRERIAGFGLELMLDHSSCLFALLDPAGQLVEWNVSATQAFRLGATPNLFELLETSSRPRFQQLVEHTLRQRAGGPVVLHFVAGDAALPHVYRCLMIALPDSQLLIYAEPLATPSSDVANEYLRVINDLSLKTRQLEAALERVAQLARVDELTQLLNRRSLMERLHEEVDRSKRYGSPLAVMLIDIDNFKRINDRYGHPVGDLVLQRVAEVMRGSIRGTDLLGRYGGEEFLAVLPATLAPAAAELAERLRRRVVNEQFTVSEMVNFQVTLSAGIAQLDVTHDTLDQLVTHADSALYLAKDSGRNCWRIWSPHDASTPLQY